MAFLNFAQPAAGPQFSVGRTAARQEPLVIAAQFDPIEWQIVGLARRDGMGSLREPGRLERLRTLLFGYRPDPRLASTRLEALRRLAVEAWHKGYTVSLSALADFRTAGFTKDQLELLLGAISVARSIRNRRSFA